MSKGQRVFQKYEFLDVLSWAGYDSKFIIKMWFYWGYRDIKSKVGGILMKLLFALLLIMAMARPAHAAWFGTGDLVGTASYLDDHPGQPIAPQLNLVMVNANPYIPNWALSEVIGAGYMPSTVGGPSGFYGRFGGDLFYAGFAKELKVGIGGAFETSRQLYTSYGDYVHVTLDYKLW